MSPKELKMSENVSQTANKHSHSTETILLSHKNEAHLALVRSEANSFVLSVQSTVFDTIYYGTLIACLSSWFSARGVWF